MDEVTSLRRFRGVTVRSIAPLINRSRKPNKSPLCLRASTSVQEKPSTSAITPPSPSSGQLLRDLTFPDDTGAIANDQLCFSNCQSPGLVAIPLIRSGLLSPCDRAQTSSRRRRHHYLNMPILLLALLALFLHPVAADSKAKVPLVRTSGKCQSFSAVGGIFFTLL